MPKETFFNLPEDKRALICDVAIDEFAEYPFGQASINRIVTKSGIAKGSFYQYFEDKKDLFLFIMQLLAQEKLKYISPVIQNPDDHDIFTLVKELFISGIQFASEHPRFAAIGNKLDPVIYQDAKADILPSSHGFFESLLENAIARGEVRPDIDIKFFSFIITEMSVVIVEYYSEFFSRAIDVSMIETVDQFIDFLKNGIGA